MFSSYFLSFSIAFAYYRKMEIKTTYDAEIKKFWFKRKVERDWENMSIYRYSLMHLDMALTHAVLTTPCVCEVTVTMYPYVHAICINWYFLPEIAMF